MYLFPPRINNYAYLIPTLQKICYETTYAGLVFYIEKPGQDNHAHAEIQTRDFYVKRRYSVHCTTLSALLNTNMVLSHHLRINLICYGIKLRSISALDFNTFSSCLVMWIDFKIKFLWKLKHSWIIKLSRFQSSD